MYNRSFAMHLASAFAVLLIFAALTDGHPMRPNFRYSKKQRDEFKRARVEMDNSKNEIKRLTHLHRQHTEAIEASKKAEVHFGHSNHKEWTNKYAQLQRAETNIGRHERMANILEEHHNPISQALRERADKLKQMPPQIQNEMAMLKKHSKHNPELEDTHYFEDQRKRRKYDEDITRHSDRSLKNAGYLLDHNQPYH
ncbi:uncharacterized protein FA14DRAFT_180758 [Meira miltonrushii]|uniref:DUF1771-domain-containing protein n=1 Tax=Meira miltonrushii TaxID=1280837 RepID=A0A316V9F6_9BASI|nr:uncharacterized protein FA14DRAFT_180758 [Meira miltonrushii]PWN34130.1 hypothetical protein FA14DRAFT_180758 [Meira miltonrushii]